MAKFLFVVSFSSVLIPIGLLQFKGRSSVQRENIFVGLFHILQHSLVLPLDYAKTTLQIIFFTDFYFVKIVSGVGVEWFNASFSESNLCACRKLYIVILNKSYLISSRLARNQPSKQFILFSGIFIG